MSLGDFLLSKEAESVFLQNGHSSPSEGRCACVPLTQHGGVSSQWATQVAVEVRPAVLEHRQLLAQLAQVTEVNSGKAEARSLRAAGHHRSPGVYHHAVTVARSLLVMASALSCCHDIALGFDGTGPQQHLGRRVAAGGEAPGQPTCGAHAVIAED